MRAGGIGRAHRRLFGCTGNNRRLDAGGCDRANEFVRLTVGAFDVSLLPVKACQLVKSVAAILANEIVNGHCASSARFSFL